MMPRRLDGMRHHYERFRKLIRDPSARDETNEELAAALDAASRAAPYCHPRLNAIAASHSVRGSVEQEHENGPDDVRRMAMFILLKIQEAKANGQLIELS